MTLALQQRTALPDYAVWDPTELLHQVDGDRELARELVAIFLEDEAQLRRDVTDAVEEGAADRLARAAHAYKGSVAAIGAQQMAAAAGELEVAGRAGRTAVAAEVARFEELASCLIGELGGALHRV